MRRLLSLPLLIFVTLVFAQLAFAQGSPAPDTVWGVSVLHKDAAGTVFHGSVAAVSADGNRMAINHGGSSTDSINYPHGMYLYDKPTGTMTLIAAYVNYGQANGEWATATAMSEDGTKVVFLANIPNLTPHTDVNLYGMDIFLYDTITDTIRLVSKSADGTSTGNASVYGGGISADGTKITFTSYATNLASGITFTSNGQNVYLYDVATDSLALITKLGTAAAGGAIATRGGISADGSMLVFSSDTSGFTSLPDTNQRRDVFLYETATGNITLISRNYQNTSSANNSSSGALISADGSTVVYSSHASNIINILDDLMGQDIFLYDVASGTNRLITYNAARTRPAAGDSYVSDISGDGRLVTFTSTAPDLTSVYDNNTWDAFLYEAEIDKVRFVTRSWDGNTGANNEVSSPILSPDGSLIVVSASSTNLLQYPPDTNGSFDLLLYDVQARTLRYMTLNHTYTNAGNGGSSSPLFDENGIIYFSSQATDLTSDTYGAPFVFPFIYRRVETLPIPTGLVVESTQPYRVDIRWQNNAPDATHIEIKRSTDLKEWQTAAVIPAQNSEYSDQGLRCGIRYYYRIRAFREEGAVYSGFSSIATVISKVCSPSDFNGDGLSDIVVFRQGAWLVYGYNSGTLMSSIWTGQGSATARPLLMDYDGDGSDDLTVYDSGAWHFFNDDGSYLKGLWVAFDALPLPADYDGDRDDDIVLFDRGAWHRFDFATGAYLGGVWTGTGTGSPAKPAPMDYDGDGTADFTIYNSGAWHFFNDNGSYLKGLWVAYTDGIPVPGDYDGDGTDDVVLFSSGAWHFFEFATGKYHIPKSVYTGTPPHKYGGTSLPAPLNYNGDGRMDYTMYAGGPWHFFGYGGTFVKNIPTGGVVGDVDVSARPALP